MTADLTGRYWLILGASSTISRAFARQVAARGASVILAGRDIDDLMAGVDDLTARGVNASGVVFDATDRATHHHVADFCRQHVPAGQLDILLAFASMPDQVAMEQNPDLAIAQIEATYTGAVAILLTLAPLVEEAKQGSIVVMSSISGDRGRVKNYIYGSSKAGLTTFAAGLRARMLRANVTVTTVKPGFLDTQMTWGLPGIFLAASPDAIAAAMLKASLKHTDSFYFPKFWALIMLVIKSIPERLFKRLSI
jgi:NAD(P)-dependent dehydrogenase (short-subunit alcohol dehydrogenase family)